jgi:hypothetical protein
LPATSNGLTSGQKIRVYGTTNYNGTYTVDAASTADKIVVAASYVAEALTMSSRYRRRLTLGSGNDCPGVETGCIVELSGSSPTIAGMSGDGAADQAVRLTAASITAAVAGIFRTTVASGNLKINRVLDADGTLNTSTTNKLPQMTSNSAPSPYTASASSEYSAGFSAWYAFNRGAGNWSSNGATNQWLEINMGAGNGFAANRWRFKTAAGADQPKRFRLEAYDGSQWIALDGTYQSQDYTQVVAGYSAWFGFVNSVSYLRYRLYVYSSYGSYIAVDELEIVEAQYPTPTGWGAAYTAASLQRNCASWQHISGVTVTQTAPGSSKLFHSVAFDGGFTWKVFLSGAWKDVVRQSTGNWQFRDAGGTWQNAATNTVHGALSQALSLANNQMSKTALEAISQSQWEAEGSFSAGVSVSLDFAQCMQADGSGSIPTLDTYAVTVLANLNLVSGARTATDIPDVASCSILVKNYHSSLKVFIASKEDPSAADWTELMPISRKAILANTVEQYATDDVAMSGHADKRIRFKVTADYGHGIEVHGYAVNWG